MHTVSTRFCNPFLPDMIEYGPTERLEAINRFVTLPWLRLNHDIYARQEEVLHNFCFFEVSYEDAGGLSYTLNIAPEYATGTPATAADLQFTIRFIRPKARKRLLGLGGSKLDKAYLTEREHNDEAFVINCLIAFIDNDNDFLEEQIVTHASLQSR